MGDVPPSDGQLAQELEGFFLLHLHQGDQSQEAEAHKRSLAQKEIQGLVCIPDTRA